jgi:hypothetical protein
MSKETLEEAAKEFVLSHDFSKLTNPNHLANRCFQFGAKWLQEKMYSEEDMRKAFKDGSWVTSWSDMGISMKYDTFEEWFEQFKKK